MKQTTTNRIGMVAEVEKVWLSNKEAQKYLGVSETWLERKRSAMKLHFSHIDKKIWYLKSDLDKMIRQNIV